MTKCRTVETSKGCGCPAMAHPCSLFWFAEFLLSKIFVSKVFKPEKLPWGILMNHPSLMKICTFAVLKFESIWCMVLWSQAKFFKPPANVSHIYPYRTFLEIFHVVRNIFRNFWLEKRSLLHILSFNFSQLLRWQFFGNTWVSPHEEITVAVPNPLSTSFFWRFFNESTGRPVPCVCDVVSSRWLCQS